jgi:hypothetical protein
MSQIEPGVVLKEITVPKLHGAAYIRARQNCLRVEGDAASRSMLAASGSRA